MLSVTHLPFTQTLTLPKAEFDVLYGRETNQADNVAISDIPPALLALKAYANNHGRVPVPGHKPRPASVWEHTIEVICGKHGGFGLRTEFAEAHPSQHSRITNIMRVAAFFHDYGKTQSFKHDHVEISIAKAVEFIAIDPSTYGLQPSDISIIVSLIKNNDLYQFTRYENTSSVESIKNMYRKAYEEANTREFSYEVFSRMLLNLYLADASTLVFVQEKDKTNGMYSKLFQPGLNFETFDWLESLKKEINAFDLAKNPYRQRS